MSDEHRYEKDFLGRIKLPKNAFYGIHTLRAMENFPLSDRQVHFSLIEAYGAVKLAAAQANHDLGSWDEVAFKAIVQACTDMMEGRLNDSVCVDALQGGAGTSTNMNVNEVLANRALQLLGKAPGDYKVVHPIDDINLHQSTNDTYPTALKIAAIKGLRNLEQSLIGLLEAFQNKEKKFRDVVKVGRTQMQDAVLTTMGRTMSAYAEAFARDRWRVYKCEERLRVINLGGTAIGTGLGAPRQYIFKVTEKLKAITGFGLARAENMVENTQNADVFVEVSGILSACATNLLKVSGDLRLMSSGPNAGLGEISLPAVQAGSSIMPGKVNPVIPEAATQVALSVIGNHSVIAQACGMGSLELNPFLPLVADCLLNSLQFLDNGCRLLAERCVKGISVNIPRCKNAVNGATATITALIDIIGYETAEAVLHESQDSDRSIRDVVIERGYLTGDAFDDMISADSVTRLGSRKET